MRRRKPSSQHRPIITTANQYDDDTWTRVIIHFGRMSNLNLYYLEGVYSTWYIHFKYCSVAEEAFEHCINISIVTQTNLGNIVGTILSDIAKFKEQKGFL